MMSMTGLDQIIIGRINERMKESMIRCTNESTESLSKKRHYQKKIHGH